MRNSLGRVLGAMVVVVCAAACGGDVRGNPGDQNGDTDQHGDRDGDSGPGGDDVGDGDGGSPSSGLTRVINTTCNLHASAVANAFEGLADGSLVGMKPVPGVSGKLVLARQSGLLLVFDREGYTAGSEHVALDLEAETMDTGGGEKGFYSFDFAPDFGVSGGYVYVSYAIENGGVYPQSGDTRVQRFTCSRDNGLTCDKDTARLVLEIPRPDAFGNHNAGEIFFGNDGMLYITTGDSANGNDPENWGQNLGVLGGKLLRIDPSQDANGKNYSIPSDNPFLTTDGALPEIYAYGFRNPWRASVDKTTGRIFVGDVGQGQWEEVDIVESGGNYGWDKREGAHDGPSGGCSVADGCIDPIHEYDHSGGRIAITGGYVYRGSAIPNMWGAYVFADYGSGAVYRIDEGPGGAWVMTPLMNAGGGISSFGYDDLGEIYILHFNGDIQRLEPHDDTNAPPTLTATGCYSDVPDRTLIAAAVRYDIQVPFWSDDADKHRAFVLPGNATITASADGSWEFPVGTILIKEFELQEEADDPASVRPVETRFLVQVAQDTWRGFSYMWNDQGTEATLRPDSELIADYTLRGEDHEYVFPSRGACNTCHTANGSYVLGVRTEQVNRDHDYGAGPYNQIAALTEAGFLTAPLAGTLPRLPLLSDESVSVGARARAWLAANCSNCHSGTANGGRYPDMRFATGIGESRLCEIIAQADPPIIPGNGAGSPIVEDRAGFRGAGQMPPLASRIIDPLGVGLLTQWIDAMDDVPAALPPQYICPP